VAERGGCANGVRRRISVDGAPKSILGFGGFLTTGHIEEVGGTAGRRASGGAASAHCLDHRWQASGAEGAELRRRGGGEAEAGVEGGRLEADDGSRRKKKDEPVARSREHYRSRVRETHL
jgi:hypothetical protein